MAAKKKQPYMSVKGLVKKFGPFTALDGVDLEVHAGEVHALLGDNGAGKSTLIKILAGVHQPTEGQIFIEGQETAFRSPRDATAAGIGTVYQDLALNQLMSITRNFFMGREIRNAFGVSVEDASDRKVKGGAYKVTSCKETGRKGRVGHKRREQTRMNIWGIDVFRSCVRARRSGDVDTMHGAKERIEPPAQGPLLLFAYSVSPTRRWRRGVPDGQRALFTAGLSVLLPCTE